jgi:hypothetical protein
MVASRRLLPTVTWESPNFGFGALTSDRAKKRIHFHFLPSLGTCHLTYPIHSAHSKHCTQVNSKPLLLFQTDLFIQLSPLWTSPVSFPLHSSSSFITIRPKRVSRPKSPSYHYTHTEHHPISRGPMYPQTPEVVKRRPSMIRPETAKQGIVLFGPKYIHSSRKKS